MFAWVNLSLARRVIFFLEYRLPDGILFFIMRHIVLEEIFPSKSPMASNSSQISCNVIDPVLEPSKLRSILNHFPLSSHGFDLHPLSLEAPH